MMMVPILCSILSINHAPDLVLGTEDTRIKKKKKKDEILILSKVIFQWEGNEHQRNKFDNFRELLLKVVHSNIR